jgi:anthranilate phosphoribosyltransferase
LQQGAFIAALKAKPETPAEVAGTFEALYEYDTIKVEVQTPEPLIDNCGTCADMLKTLNISTGAAIIVSWDTRMPPSSAKCTLSQPAICWGTNPIAA